MKVAELFVEIAVKGADKAGKSLSGIADGLTDISSKGLAAKAALIGMVYALDRMMSGSAQRGQDLKNFASLTGINTDALQRWQIAANRTGQSADSMASSMKALQHTMAMQDIGKGQPEGWAYIADTVDLDPGKITNINYMMSKMREFATSAKAMANPALANWAMGTFGISSETQITLKTFKGNIDAIARSEFLSKGTIQKLADINVQWRELWRNMSLFQDNQVAKFGAPIVETLTKAFTLLTDMIKGIETLIAKMPVLSSAAQVAFAIIGTAILSMLPGFVQLNAILAAVIWAMADIQKYRENGGWESTKKRFSDDASYVWDTVKSIPSWGNRALDFALHPETGVAAFQGLMSNPNGVPSSGGSTSNTSTTVNQTNYGVQGASDLKRMMDDGKSQRAKAQSGSSALLQRN